MKFSWPWRRKKLLSLFERQIFCTADSVSRPRISPELTPAQPHRLNAPGPFYVVNKDCMTCGYPHVLAPDLMGWEMNSEDRAIHCYFRRQPETLQEVEQALNAVNGSCCGALRYSGSDPAIIKRIR